MKPIKQKHLEWMPRFTVALLCITLLSVWMTSRTMAQHVADYAGVDNARVAQFDIGIEECVSKELSLSLNPQQTEPQEYDIEVTNSGEKAVHVTAKLELRGNLPLSVTYPSGTEQTSKTLMNTLSEDLKQDPVTVQWDFDINTDETMEDIIKIGWSEEKDDESCQYGNCTESVRLVLYAEQTD